MKNGKCPSGQYYCYTNKECKPIPAGFMVDPEGMLRKENGATVDEANKSGDNSLRDWFSKSKSSDGKPGWVQLGGKYAGKPCAKQPGQTTKPKCGSSKMKRNLSKDEEEAAFRRKNRKDPNPDRKGKAINVATEETINEKEGKKDACYHKVKSRYSVWPSAYASGALVKCRKVGAKNWGNSTKKEEFSDWRQEIQEAGKKCWKGYKKAGTQKLFGKTYNRCVKEEVCPICGYNPCQCLEGNVSIEDANGNTFAQVIDIIKAQPLVSEKAQCNHTAEGTDCPIHGVSPCDPSPKGGSAAKPGRDKNYVKPMGEATRIPTKTGNIIMVSLSWRGKLYVIKMFFPQIAKPSRSDVQDQIDKVYPGGKVNSYYVSDVKPGEHFLQVAEGAAWTKKAGKSESGGLNEKGRKSYERENPGSDLKAPSKKVGNPRRKSFCARMKGMKKKLTSSKTANDPNSRINKSLRAWNC
jgi:hypothetical protein